jgi:AraC-like DNA-binding protein
VYRELPKPEHPLISVINFEDIKYLRQDEPRHHINDFYSVALKRNFKGKFKYGQQEYDFDEGVMFFLAPGQLYAIESEPELRHEGWLLLVHPDFLWGTPLAQKIKEYEYFSYSVNEALYLSDKEEQLIIGILGTIAQEYRSNIDRFSADVIVSLLELFFTYAERFYHRQFFTRKISNHKILARLEVLLDEYFRDKASLRKGLPTVQYVADSLHVSPGYLSGMLKVLTGQSTQQRIHDKLIEKAKEKLSTTALTVSEIAYELGFEHPQSFSKLFKTKTSESPLEFRQRFN